MIVQFELGGEEYALDIGFTREIVEMMPITPIPRSPDYIVGVMNLRGEITTVLNINTLLGLSEISEREGKKIIVLSPEVAGGENLGIIVDDVRSVTQVAGDDIDQLGDALTSSQTGGRIKGIIKMRGKHSLDAHEKEGEQRDLVIWIDMQRVIEELMRRR
ncbi:MAG: chemotaxis protein CheW [Methanomicrobiales archaeon]|nr:chemotaxis protein CheW [Methanomicrobiales archaeon]